MSYRSKIALVYLLGFSLDLVNRFVALRLDTPAVLALLTTPQGKPA
ncbi:hypothetical protein SAMN05216598_2526 [Pseudomonas asplenii]|uniref:MFS transporter n=1 Tax=Pseudomonas asplenii TaxID=53407 RepID=A0A1H1UHS4_9PSED|nr:hypothetical protein [Pseudomonas asplenii]SDS72057.1 hypothetical protein SAMN05216598_2526 [Pseudomonas asplenii]